MTSATTWALSAAAAGAGRVTLRAQSSGAVWGHDFSAPHPMSRAEATALALAHAFEELKRMGARAVRIRVSDPTLDGYLHRGWQPRTPAMVAALRRLVEAAGGLAVVFVPLRAARSDLSKPPL